MPAQKKHQPKAKSRPPEWTPAQPDQAFAGRYISGDTASEKTPSSRPTVSRPDIGSYVDGIRKGDRVTLGRALTLVESNAPAHQLQAQEMLQQLPQHSEAIRIGITGTPGAGKSTFIEALGLFLIEAGHRVAVLAVDPSSSITRGSILGDKTRMEKLARHPESFIRPSPSGGALGGVARKTRETILVCEAAGYDVILVETIGVGQSEIAVRNMVDFFLLIQIAGGGDELQGIKRGVMELADAILVNKADGDNRHRAEAARHDLELALHYLQPATPGWRSGAFCGSALTGEGIAAIWDVIEKFRSLTRDSGVFQQRRQDQLRKWLREMLVEGLEQLFLQHPVVSGKLPATEAAVLEGKLPATRAASLLLEDFAKALQQSGKPGHQQNESD